MSIIVFWSFNLWLVLVDVRVSPNFFWIFNEKLVRVCLDCNFHEIRCVWIVSFQRKIVMFFLNIFFNYLFILYISNRYNNFSKKNPKKCNPNKEEFSHFIMVLSDWSQLLSWTEASSDNCSPFMMYSFVINSWTNCHLLSY